MDVDMQFASPSAHCDFDGSRCLGQEGSAELGSTSAFQEKKHVIGSVCPTLLHLLRGRDFNYGEPKTKEDNVKTNTFFQRSKIP